MRNKLIIIALLFLAVRILTVFLYKDTNYYYGMVINQFSIAEAMFNGHPLSQDKTLAQAIQLDSNNKMRFIPIEEWKNYPGSGIYTTFPAQDIPGYGYIIAFTSKCFGGELTAKYAFALQVFLEMLSLLIFLYCIFLICGERVSFIAGLIYVFGYPFIWPMASQPMRDIFLMAVYSFYFGAFLIFSRRKSGPAYLAAFFMVAVSALLLWVRPSGYFLFFLVSPLVFFVKNKSMASRVSFFLITILLPVFIFGLPFKSFNIRYYGVSDTDVLGRGMWQGLGIIEDNPYGFVCDDAVLVPWVKSRGYDVEYSSPEMNKILGEYARKIVREDPVYYLRTILKRVILIVKSPLELSPPRSLGIKSSGFFKDFGTLDSIKKHPAPFLYQGFMKFILLLIMLYAWIFFYCGIIAIIFMLKDLKNSRPEIILLVSPFFYSLAVQIPLHFEVRSMVPAAWVLIFPLAWGITRLMSLRKAQPDTPKS
ncbi:MAG: hypothetical protein M1269_04215 [Chloroflexi bacterium]|nr:hypothetical protein [Chloroflexota bacterium]